MLLFGPDKDTADECPWIIDLNVNPPFECRMYTLYLQERGGYLDHYVETHCLFHYALTVHMQLSKVKNNIVLEGTPDYGEQFKPRQIFTSICQIYGVNPNKDITQAWPKIDAQFDLLGIERIPNINELRHNQIITIVTNKG